MALPALFILSFPAMAAPSAAILKGLAPHKAVYDVDLTATHSGSQIVNISGRMTYEWRHSCDAWITNHQFTLVYAYVDGPGMQVRSDFSTYETLDGDEFHFASRRARDGKAYQEIRGTATRGPEGGLALYAKPQGLSYALSPEAIFPMQHTVALIEKAKAGDRFYAATIFDGSDEEGPIEINSFIAGESRNAVPKAGSRVDKDLLKGRAWDVRMAVFNAAQEEEESDYEMDMVFHENGVISAMAIDYDDFSVKQTLVSLEPLSADTCASTVAAPRP